MSLKIIVQYVLLCCVSYADRNYRVDVRTMVTREPESGLSAKTQAYLDWDFYVGMYSTKSRTDNFHLYQHKGIHNVSWHSDADKDALRRQLLNMTEAGKVLFDYYFGDGTGIIQMAHTCMGNFGNAYSLLTVAVDGAHVLFMTLHPDRIWTKKIDSNLADSIVINCERLLSDMTLNNTCPGWSFRIREDYRRVIGMLCRCMRLYGVE